jgi:hypothetical protein
VGALGIPAVAEGAADELLGLVGVAGGDRLAGAVERLARGPLALGKGGLRALVPGAGGGVGGVAEEDASEGQRGFVGTASPKEPGRAFQEALGLVRLCFHPRQPVLR